MMIHRTDGKVIRINIEDIDSIIFSSATDDRFDAIDLGLSVLWAACNIGADTPEGYGDYFAWGETESKESYTEENYKAPSISVGNITGTEADAANCTMGELWHTPTISEIDELTSRCTWTWTTINSINGYSVVGPSGNSIFLPAAGQKRGTELIGAGSQGYYWSSTPSQEYSTAAYNLNFTGYSGHWSANRSYGFTIRAVKSISY